MKKLLCIWLLSLSLGGKTVLRANSNDSSQQPLQACKKVDAQEYLESKSNYGYTALMIARKQHHAEIVDMLEEAEKN
jgi:ankyrin repeat protein